MSKKYWKGAMMRINKIIEDQHVGTRFIASTFQADALRGGRDKSRPYINLINFLKIHHCVQRPTQNVFQSVIIFMVITLIGGGFALLVGGRLTAPASARNASQLLSNYDLSVVGPPSLPAATVDAIFAGLGSPMAGTGKLVEQTSRQANVDDAFAVAVWWKETNDGETGVGLTNHNPGGVRESPGYPSAYSYTLYPNYAAAIVDWFHILHIRYVDYGLNTVYAISHPYVGTSNSPSWAAKVVALMLQYRGEAPPPSTPTAAPSPTRGPQMLPHRKIVADPRSARDSQSPQGTQHLTATHALPTGGKATSTGAPSLSPTIEWVIVALALLLAIAVALWAGSISGSLSVGAGAVWSGDGTLASPAGGIAEHTSVTPTTITPARDDASIPGLMPTTMIPIRMTPAPMTPTRGVTTSGLTTPLLPHWGEARGLHNPAPMVLRLPARPRAVSNTEALLRCAEPAVAPDTSALEPLTRLPVMLGTYPSCQRCYAASASRSGRTKGEGNGKFRRTILLPSQPGRENEGMPQEEMVKGDGRPPGLLARYGKTQQG